MLLAFAIGLAAINTGNNLLYLMLAMMLSLIVLSGILSERTLKLLQVKRRLPQHVFAGSPATAYFSIANLKTRSPSFSLRFLDVIEGQPLDRGVHVLHVPPGGSLLRSYLFTVPRRGPYRIDAIKVSTRFPFSLFVKSLTQPLESEIVVYPKITPLPQLILKELRGLGHEQQQPLPQRGQGWDLYNLRWYQPGDDSRSIHWRTTARTNALVVRETEAEAPCRVTVILPTDHPPPPDFLLPEEQGRSEALFEQAVEIAASLARHFEKAGYAVGAYIGAQHIPSEPGVRNLHRILRTLGLCTPAPTPIEASSPLPLAPGILPPLDGGMVFIVLPWPIPQVESTRDKASTIICVWKMQELSHAA